MFYLIRMVNFGFHGTGVYNEYFCEWDRQGEAHWSYMEELSSHVSLDEAIKAYNSYDPESEHLNNSKKTKEKYTRPITSAFAKWSTQPPRSVDYIFFGYAVITWGEETPYQYDEWHRVIRCKVVKQKGYDEVHKMYGPIARLAQGNELHRSAS